MRYIKLTFMPAFECTISNTYHVVSHRIVTNLKLCIYGRLSVHT